jgi:hypothetical protein
VVRQIEGQLSKTVAAGAASNEFVECAGPGFRCARGQNSPAARAAEPDGPQESRDATPSAGVVEPVEPVEHEESVRARVRVEDRLERASQALDDGRPLQLRRRRPDHAFRRMPSGVGEGLVCEGPGEHRLPDARHAEERGGPRVRERLTHRLEVGGAVELDPRPDPVTDSIDRGLGRRPDAVPVVAVVRVSPEREPHAEVGDEGGPVEVTGNRGEPVGDLHERSPEVVCSLDGPVHDRLVAEPLGDGSPVRR